MLATLRLGFPVEKGGALPTASDFHCLTCYFQGLLQNYFLLLSITT